MGKHAVVFCLLLAFVAPWVLGCGKKAEEAPSKMERVKDAPPRRPPPPDKK